MSAQLEVSGASGLVASRVTKLFAGVAALTDVSIAVRPGEIVGLAGHNGAGKSTLLKILSGVYRPDEGAVFLDGVPIELHSPHDALSRGISTVHQELALLGNLTAMQNIFLARERTRLGFLQLRDMRAEAEEMVERFGLDIDVNRPVGDYPVATRQLMELAIAMQRNARFLLLDEPTTSLEGDQIDRLLTTIRSMAQSQGVGIILIDHKLDELYAVADTMVALVDGYVRINRPTPQVEREDMVRAVAGDEAIVLMQEDEAATEAASTPEVEEQTDGVEAGRVALRVVNLRTPELKDVNLSAKAGRVLGIYGLVGSGRTEFLRTLIGMDDVEGGTIEVFGSPYQPRNPAAASAAGIVYLTEERKRDGIVAALNSNINVALPVLRRYTQQGFLRPRVMQRSTDDYLDLLKVRGDRRQPVTRLSGGNQQKILFARALAQEPKLLLLDEPTKGVDIGVKMDIHRRIRELAHDRGITIVLVSSEEEEVLEVADDVVVFVSGRCDGRMTLAKHMNATQLRREAWVPA